MPDKLALLAPLTPPRNLVDEVAARVGDDIRSGRLAPGTRLPTGQAMTAALGVSRTVVREAVAALKADGLVVTRRGSGAYVADLAAHPFRMPPEGLRSLSDVVDIMELRLAVEVETAALAAERATRAQVAAIRAALSRIDRALKRGFVAVPEDFAFHHAIAAAAGNGQFPRFLEFLGRQIIPRQSARASLGTPAERSAYLRQIQREHRRIVAAIADGDRTAAARAMREHLSRSVMRYRALARGGGVPGRASAQISAARGRRAGA